MPMFAASPAPQPQSAPSHIPILMVEDDDGIRSALRFVLEDAGYAAVAEARTMKQAAAYLSTTLVAHVVLLDFRNPHGNADMLLRLVEQEAALQRHRYVLMPASHVTHFSDEAQRLINTVCAEVVYKPFDLAKLLGAIERAAAQLVAHPPSL